MTQQRFVSIALLTTFALCVICTSDAPAEKCAPNFIIVMADDCSAKEFGCYGNSETSTPRLDELATTGVMFKTAWCAPI